MKHLCALASESVNEHLLETAIPLLFGDVVLEPEAFICFSELHCRVRKQKTVSQSQDVGYIAGDSFLLCADRKWS